MIIKKRLIKFMGLILCINPIFANIFFVESYVTNQVLVFINNQDLPHIGLLWYNHSYNI